MLEFDQQAVLAAQCIMTTHGWPAKVEIDGVGIAQAHLPSTVSIDRIIELAGANIGPVALQQTRELIADLLGL